MGCTGLVNVTIPESVTSIDRMAFQNCTSITSITILKGVINIATPPSKSEGVFQGCTSLASVTICCARTWSCFSGLESIKELILEEGVTTIDYEAFKNCTGLTDITIPSSITSIGENAFSNTAWYNNHSDGVLYLDNWLIGYKGEEVGDHIIPEGTKGIADFAFRYCSSLTSISIPSSLTIIGSYPFLSCAGIASMSVDEGNKMYDSRNNCNAIILTAENKLLFGCNNTVIPTGVTSIGDNAFNGCTGLTSMNIPEGVESIGISAFTMCNSLTSVIIPSTVTSFGNWCFSCNNLSSVTSLIQEPFPIKSVFMNSTYENGTLYVPYGTKAKYEATDGWKNFTNIVEMEDETAGKLLLISKTIDDVEYKLYKQCTDKNDVHENPDGWRCYKSQLILEVTKEEKTASYVVDDDIYLDDMPNEGQMPCMMFDMSTRQMYAFCISKDDRMSYSMEGYFYASSMDNVSFQKERPCLRIATGDGIPTLWG